MWVCTKSHYATNSTSPEKSPDCWQLALDYRTVSMHVGTEAPTEGEYGEHWTDLIWLDTDDGSLGLEVYSKNETDACVENALKTSKEYTDTKLLQESTARKDSNKILDDKITSTQASIEESYKEYTNNEIKTLRNEITKTINAIANNKVDKVTGKQLSTEDFTTAEKEKLDGIDLSLYYTSSQVDTKIGDLTTSFNGKLSEKADKATTLAGYGIINAYTKDEVNTAVETAKKEILGITDDETINAAYDTLKEVADWITNDKSGAAAMLSDIANLKTGKAEQEEVNELRGKLDNISVDLLININHADLCDLKNAGNLVPGQKYRIEDYVTIINEAGKFSDEHPFDIVVTALSENTLSEEASAIAHEEISFFDKYNLSA